MSKMFGSAELRVKIKTDLFFLLPGPPTEPSQDTIVDGTVELTLPSARKVKKLDVELVGRQNMFLLKKYEQYDTFRKKLTLDLANEYGSELPAGTHEFAWSFIVPANTAPYERADYGRTYHKVYATAQGLGRLGADLTATSDEIGLVCNSNDPGQAAQGFSSETETTHEVLGPLRMHLFSRFFLIAGYLRMSLSLPGVAQRCRLDDICVILRQDIRLQSLKDPERSEQARAKPILLWSMAKNEKGTIIEPEEEYHLVRQMKLADDDTVRPSSNEWSNTGIRVSHALQTIIRFTPLPDAKGKGPAVVQENMKEMKISHPCKLSSCDCMIGNLQLPSYSKEDPIEQAAQRLQGHKTKCLCRVSQAAAEDEMIRLYGSDLESLGAASRFGTVTRGRNDQWKDDDEYGNDLESDLRSRSRSRSPWPGRSPSHTPTVSQPASRSQSRAPSRPPSRTGRPVNEHYFGRGPSMI